MLTVKRFGVLSVGIISGILSATGGLIAGLMMAAMVATIPMYEAVYEDMGYLGWVFGGAAIIIFPIFYGVFGFIGGIIMAALYNLFQKWVGGIKLELRQDMNVTENIMNE